MKPQDIEVGLTYHNGKDGPRSFSSREVIEMGLPVQHANLSGTIDNSGVKYLQLKGPYSGQIFIIPLKSFASWAKGIVKE